MPVDVLLQAPHAFKPAQAVNALLIAISLAATGVSGNGLFWLCCLLSLLVSLSATVLFALGTQDQIMDQLSSGSVSWNVLEMVYSFTLAVLSVICTFLSFSAANGYLGGTSAAYISSGLLWLLQTGLYGWPSVQLYNKYQEEQEEDGLYRRPFTGFGLDSGTDITTGAVASAPPSSGYQQIGAGDGGGGGSSSIRGPHNV